MLRTCNALRIAGLPVLRKDGARRRDEGGRVSNPPLRPPRNPRPNPPKPPSLEDALPPQRRGVSRAARDI
ncbi:MAG: hypothetical protein LBM98_02805 [Oscillospiraceae bacterium]|nr:hypothetical protein [Oscillospiraceae bacterium]